MKDQIIIGKAITEIKQYCGKILYLSDSDISGISEGYEYFLLDNSCNEDGITIKVYIYKDSDEGREFALWLKNIENHKVEAVRRKYLQYVLPHLTVETFIKSIDIKSVVLFKGI